MRQIIASLLFLFYLGEDRYVEPPPQTKICTGNTKIGYGVGVNCKGDTIEVEEFRKMYQDYLETQKIK